MATRLVVALLLFCVAANLGGCTSCRDVSKDPQYLGARHIGQTYSLREDVFLVNVNHGRPFFDPYPCTPGLWLIAPGSKSNWYGSRVPSIGEYHRTDKPGGVLGVVPAGTKLSLSKIIFYDFFEGTNVYHVFTVLDGPYRGKSVCANELLWDEPRYLQPAP